MTETHWAKAFIGMPWVAGRSDCWSFARKVWQQRFGWDVPPLTVDPVNPRAVRHALAANPADVGWASVADPAEGDAVLMARGQRPCHVGIWIAPEAGAGVLHSVEVAGVIFTAPDRLSGLNYAIAGFWRWGAA